MAIAHGDSYSRSLDRPVGGAPRSAYFTDADIRELEHDIQRLDWDEVDEILTDEWGAGQHVSIFAPTEGGKSHLIRYGLLPHWKRYPVMWIRFKQKDDSTEGFGIRVQRFPVAERVKYAVRSRNSDRWEDDPEWYLLQLPGYRFHHGVSDDKTEAWHRARSVCGEVLDRVYIAGGWVVVIDEVRALNGRRPPSLDLESVLENCWQRGRTQPLTIIAAMQQPAWAPTSMYDQPRYIFLGRPLDEGRFERIGELGGDSKRIEAILPTLKGARDPDGPEFLLIDRWRGDMWIAVAPPRE